jgi:hypothetical protein
LARRHRALEKAAGKPVLTLSSATRVHIDAVLAAMAGAILAAAEKDADKRAAEDEKPWAPL